MNLTRTRHVCHSLALPRTTPVISRSAALALVAALFAVTALLLWPVTAAAGHGPKKVPHGQQKKLQAAATAAPAALVTPRVFLVQRPTAPSVAPSVAPAPRRVAIPAGVTQPVAVPQRPVQEAPLLAAPERPIGAAPVIAQPAPPVARPVPRPVPGTVPGPATAIEVTVPYEAMGVATGAAGTLLLALLLLAVRRPRLSSAHQALARELGLRPRQLAALTGVTAEGALARVRSRREEAMLDDLTGILRRGAGVAALEREVARAQRSLLGRLVVAFIDVDGLKEVNDTMGHAAGDQLLRAVAAALSSRLRGQDLVLRYGGDEFVVVLPDTDLVGAHQTLLEIRARLQERMGRKPFSLGLTEMRAGDSAESLVRRADAALYENRRLDLP